MNNFKIINFGQDSLVSCDNQAATKLICDSISNCRKKVFIHKNMYNYYFTAQKIHISNEIKHNSVFFFEGIALKIAELVLGGGVNKDVNGTDLFPVLFEKLNSFSGSVFLLGSKEKVIQKAIRRISEKYPSIKIKGYHHGFFNESEEKEIVKKIREAEPELIIIGMGIRKEIEFLNRNYSEISNFTIWNVGGLFDFVSGAIQRAPLLIRRMRLEWFFRFLRQPVNKFHRCFVVPFWFFFRCMVLVIERFNTQNNRFINAKG